MLEVLEAVDSGVCLANRYHQQKVRKQEFLHTVVAEDVVVRVDAGVVVG